MATTRPNKTGKAHEAVWNIDGRQRTKSPFPTKRAAQKYGEDQEAAHRRGAYVDPNAPTTVETFAREYAALKSERKVHRASTALRMQSVIDNHLAGTDMGAMRLGAVKRQHWDRWEAERFGQVGSAYARKIIRDVRSMFAQAVEYSLIPASPAPLRIGQSAPRIQKIEKTLSRGEVERLIAAMAGVRPECAAMVTVQAGLGLRLGELIALRVSDVNRFAKTVRVEWQITGTAGTERVELKTERSKAVIRAPGYVIDALAEHLANYPTGIDGSVFTHHGRAWQQGPYRLVFKRALKAAGLASTWRPHDLRHHAATMMLAEGYSYPQIARFLREKEQTVMETYGHATDDEDAVADGMDRAWSRREVAEPNLSRGRE